MTQARSRRSKRDPCRGGAFPRYLVCRVPPQEVVDRLGGAEVFDRLGGADTREEAERLAAEERSADPRWEYQVIEPHRSPRRFVTRWNEGPESTRVAPDEASEPRAIWETRLRPMGAPPKGGQGGLGVAVGDLLYVIHHPHGQPHLNLLGRFRVTGEPEEVILPDGTWTWFCAGAAEAWNVGRRVDADELAGRLLFWRKTLPREKWPEALDRSRPAPCGHPNHIYLRRALLEPQPDGSLVLGQTLRLLSELAVGGAWLDEQLGLAVERQETRAAEPNPKRPGTSENGSPPAPS